MPSTESTELELRNLNSPSDDQGRTNPETRPLAEQPTSQKMRLDPNVYATKKTIAQGMLDIALLTANASQLKYVLQVGTEHEFYYPLITMISISIILQVTIGTICCILPCISINNETQQKAAHYLNQSVLVLSYAVSLVNTLIPSFTSYAGSTNSTLKRDYMPMKTM